MRIPNYDSAIENNNFKRLLPYMPSNTFRMLFCGPSGCGKTNTLMHMLYNLLYYDKIYFKKFQKIWNNQSIRDY